MNGFLDELGKKAAHRWLSLLILPGLLWTLTLLATTHLHHSAPTTLQPAVTAIDDWTTERHTTTTMIIVLLGLLLASAAVGLTANGLAVLVRHTWGIRGRHRPARLLITWRLRRWERYDKRALHVTTEAVKCSNGTNQTIDAGPGLADALARRDAISLEPPQRPTWIGDYWQSTYTRIHRTHGLDLTIAWPRLWAVLPDNLRTDISAAYTAYTSASTLTAWALLYLIPTTLWWPIALVTLATLAVGQLRARTTTRALCQLIETATDLHTHTLTQALRPPDPDTGYTLSKQLRKEPPHK